MRLIDVKTYELKEFFNQVPPYAILSHTWGSEEVKFEEYLLATDRNNARGAAANAIKQRAGFAKIMGACRRAQEDKLQYLWCDTNCIDKRSSAELSEAINSMYAWYRDSVVCYAFLADVDGAVPGSFARSRWFTRGWTLQELLAPEKVVFFDGRWKVLGDRKQLAQSICDITRIHIGALHDRNTVSEYSVAQRMSWVAGRQTSRHEDIAYCLLGIFNINMPLLYGEGKNAFLRLQQEIIRDTDDQSILAWDLIDPRCPYGTGIFAPSPDEFRYSGSIVRHAEVDRSPYSVTNVGISARLPTIKTYMRGVVLAGLNCGRELFDHHASLIHQRGPIRHRNPVRIWLVLIQTKHGDIYLKGHHPASKIFLYDTYPIMAKTKSRDLFLSTNIEPVCWQINSRDLLLPFQLSLPIMSSGPLITISSGDFKSKVQMFQDGYPLNRFHIVSLKQQDNGRVSHHLVSSGSFCIIISLLWNKDVVPKAHLTGQMALREGWSCLLNTNHVSRDGCCDTGRGLQSLHERLRKTPDVGVSALQAKNEHPLVFVTDTPLQGAHGFPAVRIDIIFREKGNQTGLE
ncbi:HET-domain-containing protein [Xylaria sp. CBS 124048]|nr:HET-domain-containing protein [Xylaria sp. CBS 124048]